MPIRAVSVRISGLALDRVYARAGVPVTASYSVNGDTTITATVSDADGTGGEVERLPTNRSAGVGAHELVWDGAASAGGLLSDGRYIIRADSVDPLGNRSAAKAPVVLDRTPPMILPIHPSTIPFDVRGVRISLSRSDILRLAISDEVSGVAAVILRINGRTVRSMNMAGILSYRPNALPFGRHSATLHAVDKAGNEKTLRGIIEVVKDKILRRCGGMKVRGGRIQKIRATRTYCLTARWLIRKLQKGTARKAGLQMQGAACKARSTVVALYARQADGELDQYAAHR